ncbi:MAG TPA: hypothetical protein VMB52_05985 [Verrucomicrobiae bacterium]|nr:hypothetical protein [Verrucomicrobiae bacterium]
MGYRLTDDPSVVALSTREFVNFGNNQMPRGEVMEVLHGVLDAQLAINGLAATHQHDFYSAHKLVRQFDRDYEAGDV